MSEDEDEKADPKICLLLQLLSSAAAMSTRSLFTFLLLIVFAATFTCRFSLSISSSAATATAVSQPSSTLMDLPVHNSTLLNLAESDPGEPRLRKEIEQLIEGNFDKLARFRPFILWRRFTAAVDIRNRSYSTSRANIRSPAFYRIYRRFQALLSDWSTRRDQTSLDSVLDDILPLLGRRNKYSSCAVVGNSGILLNAARGAAIDSHDAVIRLNNARISGFARDVGEKTTISFVNSNILHLCARRKDCPCYPYGAGVPLLLYICQPIHFLDFATCNATSLAPILVTDPRFDLLCGKIIKYYSLRRWFGAGGEDRNRSLSGWTSAHDGMLFHYSSGMQAVVTAAAVCQRVSLFGFGKAATAKHHYHTNQKAELHLHDYEAEYEFYRDLMERPYLIPFLPLNSGFHFPPLQIYH